ncbi:ABC transporter ATP-binding protein, partial [Candidatus Bipolaricaulota bacterium]|nr:ABC transporter ATP-binding protein [Candidatus Bipolaricaulota bacterium]
HFHELNSDGRTILLTTHYLNEAEWCDRVGLMQRGRLIAEGTPDELKLKAAVQSGQVRPDMEEVFLILTRESVAGGVS